MRKPRRYQQVPPVLLRQRYRSIELFAVAVAQLQHSETAPVQCRNRKVLAKRKIISALLHQSPSNPLAFWAAEQAFRALFAFCTEPWVLHGPHVSHNGVRTAS